MALPAGAPGERALGVTRSQRTDVAVQTVLFVRSRARASRLEENVGVKRHGLSVPTSLPVEHIITPDAEPDVRGSIAKLESSREAGRAAQAFSRMSPHRSRAKAGEPLGLSASGDKRAERLVGAKPLVPPAALASAPAST